MSRYVTASKFGDMLNTGALFFCRLDKLHDPLEGLLPDANRKLPSVFGIGGIDPASPKAEEAFNFKRRVLGSFRRHGLVNCWRVGSEETPDMWSMYAPGPDGVMIVSTFSRLASSFAPTPHPIYLSAVRYLDPGDEPVEERQFFNAATRKEPRYAFENELRAMTSALPEKLTPEDYWRDQVEVGMHIEVDLRTLLLRVVLSRDALHDARAMIESQLSAAGLDVPVTDSSLILKDHGHAS